MMYLEDLVSFMIYIIICNIVELLFVLKMAASSACEHCRAGREVLITTLASTVAHFSWACRSKVIYPEEAYEIKYLCRLILNF